MERAKQGHKRLGYVVGPIASVSPITVFRNIREIRSTAKEARREHGIPVVTPFDIALPLQAFRRVSQRIGMADTIRIQRAVLNSGHVTDVFIAPGSENSQTASDDRRTAENLEIAIHQPKPQEAVA